MARNLYGASTADYATNAAGAPVAGAVLYVYATAGGTAITDLLGVADALYTPGAAITSVTSGANGTYAFYGPDGEDGTLYLKTTVSAVDYWYAVNPSNEGDNRHDLGTTVSTLSSTVTSQGTSISGKVANLGGVNGLILIPYGTALPTTGIVNGAIYFQPTS